MRIALLANSQSKPTALKLTEETGYDFYWKRNNQRRFPLRPNDGIDVLIRWGCATPFAVDVATVNNPKAIQLAANKLKTIQVLKEKGIPTLELTNSYPCIGRTIHHSRGRGLWICDTMIKVLAAQSAGAEYFVKIFEKDEEYRVHVVSGTVLFVQKKVMPESSWIDRTFHRRGNEIIWNKDNGAVFQVVPQDEWQKAIVEPAIKAVLALGLDFGAVDVLVDTCEDDEPDVVICEVNTAPALDGYSLEKYTQYFKDIETFGEVPERVELDKQYAKSYRYKYNKLQRG